MNPPCESNLWVTVIFSCVKRKKKVHAFKSSCPPTCLNLQNTSPSIHAKENSDP